MAEQLYNNVTDSLAAGITSGATTLAPGTPSAWPSTGNYRIECEGEIMVVTSNDGTLLHVTRGQEGTTAAAHATGATMQLIPTAGGMTQWRTDLVASVSNNSTPRVSVTASYLSTPGLANVYLTVLKTDGTTILARTTSGVAESGTVPGLYQATITYASVAPNLELILKWDEGTSTVYTPDLVQWPAGAGSVWRSGSGAPSNSLGVDNDFYVDTVSGNMYQRVSGVYTVVATVNISTSSFGYSANIKNYGVKGDGVTDDTASINSYLSGINTGSDPSGASVYFPDGTYLITNTITVPKKVRIYGSNQTTCKIKADSSFPANTPMIILSAASTAAGTAQSCRVERMEVDCNSVAAVAVMSTEVQENSGVFDAIIKSFTAYGIVFGAYYNAGVLTTPTNSGAQNFSLRNLQINTPTNTAIDGIRLDKVSSKYMLSDITVAFTAKCKVSGGQTGPGSGTWTLTVDDTSLFPSSGTLFADNQTLVYSAKASSTTFTITSGGYGHTFATNTGVGLTGTNAIHVTSNGGGSGIYQAIHVEAVETGIYQELGIVAIDGFSGHASVRNAFRVGSGSTARWSIDGYVPNSNSGGVNASAVAVLNDNTSTTYLAANCPQSLNYVNPDPTISTDYATKNYVDTLGAYENARQVAEASLRGWKAWTAPQHSAWASNAPASQTEYACKIFLPLNIAYSITGAVVSVISAGSTLTSGQSLVTLYNSAGTKQGSTADQSAVWTSAGTYPMAFSGGPYSFTGGPGVYVWASVLCNGTTPASFRSHASATGMANISTAGALSGASLITGRIGTAVTAPASMTPSSLVATGAVWYWIALY